MSKQIIQLDILRCPRGTCAQPHSDGYGRMEVLLLDSARIHSSVCFNSLRTSFSRSLLDFNSSSRHCFILLFSYDGKRLVNSPTKGSLPRAPSAHPLSGLHHRPYLPSLGSSPSASKARQPPASPTPLWPSLCILACSVSVFYGSGLGPLPTQLSFHLVSLLLQLNSGASQIPLTLDLISSHKH